MFRETRSRDQMLQKKKGLFRDGPLQNLLGRGGGGRKYKTNIPAIKIFMQRPTNIIQEKVFLKK